MLNFEITLSIYQSLIFQKIGKSTYEHLINCGTCTSEGTVLCFFIVHIHIYSDKTEFLIQIIDKHQDLA